jgi:hypothetical protein
MKGRINTDTDQTKDIKHNKNFVLVENFIIIELGKNEERREDRPNKKSFFFFEFPQSKTLQFSNENRRNHTFIQYLN